jgi:hypothetical protein
MEEPKEARTYEFTHEESDLLSRLAKGLLRFGAAILVAGVLLVIYIVVAFFDPVPLVEVSDAREYILAAVDYALWVLISFLVIYLSVTVIRLSKPIRLITGTSGADISHLMEFVKELTRITSLSFFSLLIICVLLLVSLVMMILIF